MSMKGRCGFFLSNDLSFISRDDIKKYLNETACEFEALQLEVITK